MSGIRKILFPVDFSPACEAMAPLVVRTATIFSARVTLLYVLEPAATGFELTVQTLREVEEYRAKAAEERLQTFLAGPLPADTCERLVRDGLAAETIAAVANQQGFDLIVMPTHAGAFRRMLLGSTSAKVLDSASCPVLTTQHAETISPGPLQHRRLLCAVTLQSDASRLMAYAAGLAADMHASCTLVHVIPASEPQSAIQLDLEERLQSAERRSAQQRMERMAQAAGLTAKVHIAIGPVKEALIEAARLLEADVLLIGRSPQTGPSGRLPDLSYALVRDAPCPVLSV